jgi:2-keto-4-pentenoate hydratase
MNNKGQRMLDEAAVMRAAKVMFDARKGKYQIDAIPLADRPVTLEDAYAVQHRLFDMLGGKRDGWFLGGTNDSPVIPVQYAAPILEGCLQNSGAQLSAQEFITWEVDVEYGFTLGLNVNPRPDGYTLQEVTQVIATVHPTFDIVNCHFKDFDTVGWPSIIADIGVDGAIIRGPGTIDWTPEELAELPASLFVNGDLIEIGSGAKIMGNPLNALHWFINHACREGMVLPVGEFVSTGSCTNIFYGKLGDHVTADFGKLGTVEVHFTP